MRVRIKTKQIDFIANDFVSPNHTITTFMIKDAIPELKQLITHVVDKSKELINEQNKLS